MINDDCMRIVLYAMPAQDIIKMKAVSFDWKSVVDSIDNDAWRHLYQNRVRWISSVSPNFNWMRALIRAERSTSEIEACCVWNRQKVRLISPWIGTEDNLHLDNTFLLGTSLRTGISRDLHTSYSSQGLCIHFVYDDAFELRGIRKTCIRRGESFPCYNCEKRKRCQNQQYTYYVRKLDNPYVNDHLCMRVRGVVAL